MSTQYMDNRAVNSSQARRERETFLRNSPLCSLADSRIHSFPALSRPLCRNCWANGILKNRGLFEILCWFCWCYYFFDSCILWHTTGEEPVTCKNPAPNLSQIGCGCWVITWKPVKIIIKCLYMKCSKLNLEHFIRRYMASILNRFHARTQGTQTVCH